LKKHDIKFAVTVDDKRKLMLMAFDADLSLTQFCSQLVRKELVRYRMYSKLAYPTNGVLIHVKLEEDYFKMVQTLAVQWLLPYRQVVHRLVANYLNEPNPIDAMVISYTDL
jgi:hypothetical protein